MYSNPLPLLLLLLLVALLPLSLSSCQYHQSDLRLLSLAFASVSNFRPPAPSRCRPIRSLLLPSRNLSGSISWTILRNLSALRSLDLSDNALLGSIPGAFWSHPSLSRVNLSSNRLGGALRFGAAQSGLITALDLSRNRFTAAEGLARLAGLSYLDLSRNSIVGILPDDLPPLAGLLRFLNVSFNNFSGRVDDEAVRKFGRSAFVRAGNIKFVGNSASSSSSPPSATTGAKAKAKAKTVRKRSVRLSLVIGSAFAAVVGVLFCVLCVVRCSKKVKRKAGKDEEEAEGKEGEVEGWWVAEARWSAPVVMFEKPLMALTFADLAAATSGFGRESQLAEGGGRSGAAYRAVLPDDYHVVVRVLDGTCEFTERDDDDSDSSASASAAAAFRELARLRHPNLLPLLGYCISGRNKLLLYEYMERGDLRQWLHELPAGRPNVEDWSGDTWEIGGERRAALGDWPTRHRIALGVARGLAFLHQGWAGSGHAVVHGHLVPSNILLAEDLEPRIADFGRSSGAAAAAAAPEDDVYSFGVVLMELLTGRAGWDEGPLGRARGAVRDGKGWAAVDPRLTRTEGTSPETEKETVECLRVGYLCTAQSPEKRPNMQQVVGLLKDARPPRSTTTTTTTSSTSSDSLRLEASRT